MRTRIPSLVLLLAIAGCQVPPAGQLTGPPPTPAPVVVAASAAPEAPATRPDLKRKWLRPGGVPRYPPRDGFATPPVLVVLPPGLLLDRFGRETGQYFSPKGALHAARALPSVCAERSYAVYRVRAPLPVWAGTTAQWFDEPGGATQFKTNARAEMLLADGILERMPHQGPPPCR